MFEIKDKDGNTVEFEKLPKEHQGKIIQAIIDYIHETKEIEPLEFTLDNWNRLVKEVGSINK